jgi:creatinine amidohydrolase
LSEANYKQLKDYRPNLAVLPWGAAEAHNYHMPHGTDNILVEGVATRAVELAHAKGARPVLLPTIPFGNDELQLDQAATISITTATAAAILSDVARSLSRQGIDRLALINGHGGNEFKPLIRDTQTRFGVLMVLINYYQMIPEVPRATFEMRGDHADEQETSLMLHLQPGLVQLEQAGPGKTNPFKIEGLQQPGVWTPRPWSVVHPDTGCGDPSKSTAEKGARYFDRVTAAVADVLVAVSKANKGDLPYL